MLRTILMPSALATALTLALAGQAAAEEIVYRATMDDAHEVPPKTGKGTGEAEARLDTTTRELTYKVSWKDLSGPATAAHFHGPAKPGANAGVIVPIGAADPKSPVSGKAVLTDAQVKYFLDGEAYVNVHTAQNPGGEIRGQLHQVKP